MRPGTQIKIEPFGGMIPAIDARLLPPNNAEETENVWLYDGRLRAMREFRAVHTLDDPETRTVFRIPLAGPLIENISSSFWMEFKGLNTSVVKSPNVDTQDTLYYWCGDTPLVAPRYNSQDRIIAGVDSLILGVGSPSQDPTVSPSGGVSGTTEARSYVYTYVSVFGEEGAPSNPTTVTTGKIDDTWTVTMTDAPTDRGPLDTTIVDITKATEAKVNVVAHGYVLGNRIYFRDVVGMTEINGLYGTVVNVLDADNFRVDIDSTSFTAYVSGGLATRVDHEFTKKRIYRTVTSDQGVATFFFVAEVDIDVTTYADTASSETVSLNEQLTSQTFDPPPTDLEGFVAMPNGMIVGWRANEVWFCEPYHPHAWPPNYTQHVEFPIVGIGVASQTAVICTEGSPFLCTGIRPDSATLSRVSGLKYPCTSKGSIVGTPGGVYYASTVGLIAVTAGGAEVVTSGLASQNDWQRLLTLARLNAAIVNGAYYCFTGVGEGCFESTAFETTAFETEDFTGSRTGAMIAFGDQRIAFNRLNSPTKPIYNVLQDPWSSEVFLVDDGVVYLVDLTDTSLEGTYRWKSKIFRMDVPTNLGAGVVFHSPPTGQDDATTTLNVYATPLADAGDMELIYTRTLPVSGQEFRLPSGALHNFYQFELVGTTQVSCMQFATTLKELRGL